MQVILDPSEPTPLADALIAEKTFGGRPDDRRHAIAVYEAHVNEVVATVSKERLLLHRLGDGWEPLCSHLGVPVPDVDFPSVNQPSHFFERLSKRQA